MTMCENLYGAEKTPDWMLREFFLKIIMHLIWREFSQFYVFKQYQGILIYLWLIILLIVNSFYFCWNL